MTGTDMRLAELERQVAGLSAEVKDLREQACMQRTLEEMTLCLRRAGTAPAVPARRARHLRAVPGGAS